jgi:NitT/TauT family transport system ATP-binding protein
MSAITSVTEAPAAVTLSGVSKVYGKGGTAVRALEELSLTVAPGEFTCLIGASGCGKSTLLSLVAGLERPTTGTLQVGGRVALMFQEAGLFPWLTAAGNVELALRRLPRAERGRRAAELLDVVQLGGFADKRPHELSGGMRQRVSLARALAQDADVLLMDEPFGALDVQTRNLMENDLLELWAQFRRTVVFVTHDLEEAIALSDRIVVMTASPGHVKSVYTIALPRPRSVTEIRFHPDFGRLYETIWKDLKDEVRLGYERSRHGLPG